MDEGGNAGEDTPASQTSEALPGQNGLVVVFGATGGTGLAFVELALSRHFAVRAFVRNADLLRRELRDVGENEALEIVQGNLTDLAAVEASVEGARAIVCVAGSKPETLPGPMADAVPAMVEGCRRFGVRRLIYQSCALAMVTGERVGWFTQANLIRTIVKYQLGSNVVNDNEAVMEYLKNDAHDVSWVVSRPAGLADGDSKGTLVPCMDPFRTATVRYVDLAEWALTQVDSDTYVGKMPRLYYDNIEHPI